MKKLLFVFGTRPEAIKLSPVVIYFKKYQEKFSTSVLVTAQHRQMLDQVLKVFDIKPDFDLNLMTENQTLEQLTAKILNQISDVLTKTKPDFIFVQGDTTTTFSASLAAFYQRVPVVHIEAGLRTKNIYSPFPEEINRRITTSIAKFHFPPTNESRKNLLREGISANAIKVSGNTVIDALFYASKKVDQEINFYEKEFFKKYNINFSEKKTILITGHRRESFGKGFENICNSILKISKNKKIQIIYPVHLNPNVQKPVNRILKGYNNIYLIEPQDYLPFIFLMKSSYIILTDSGGVQEEGPSLAKPVLVMRDNTERPEGVKAGTAKLVGTNADSITSAVDLLLNNKDEYKKMANKVNPYGDGSASKIIYDFFSEII